MKYYSPSEAAAHLSICKVTILRRIRDGAIEAVKIGPRSIKISEEALQRYIKKNTINS